MIGDLQPYNELSTSALATRTHQVAANGSAPTIYAGEPVSKVLGTQYVISNPTSGQVVGTNYLTGVAQTTSTETASADGTVQVVPISSSNHIWLIAPAVPATWAPQSAYNALVGARVLIQKSGGIYTILATDGATNGCVVENLNVVAYPGKVAFSFRAGLNYLA